MAKIERVLHKRHNDFVARMMKNRNLPLCSLCPVIKKKTVRDVRGKRVMLRMPIEFDSEGRQVIKMKRPKLF